MLNPQPAAHAPQPYADSRLPPRQRSNAPQSWMVRVADAKYYWYDLLAGAGEKPELHDPIGRYLRRMEFELDATAAQRHLFLAVSRPRARFDVTGAVQWGFSSLKLTLPLLLGAEHLKDNLTIELQAPLKAALRKPSVILSPSFISLNWGGLVEVFSVHDLLQAHGHSLRLPGKVAYVGHTRDPDGQLGKGRLPALQEVRARLGKDADLLLLVLGVQVAVSSAEGDPAALPDNQQAAAADALQAERIDMIETALIRHFEGSAPRWRSFEERQQRSARIVEVQESNQLVQYTVDLALPPSCGHYNQLGSEHASAAARHLLSCFIADGQAQVAPMPLPAPAKA